MNQQKQNPYQLNFNGILGQPSESFRDHKVNYKEMPVSQSTFKAGLAASTHRWFRLTPSFGPELVREMLAKLECGLQDVVLDPFAGKGTTLIECQLEGLTSYGSEINPFLHWVGSVCTNWDIDTDLLEALLEEICAQFAYLDRLVDPQNLGEYGLSIPTIHNPTRWWRPDVLKQLLVLKFCIESLQTNEDTRAFFQLALAAVLVPDLSNVTLGRLQLHFIDRTNDDIQVLNTFVEHARKMIEDVGNLKELSSLGSTNLFYHDATKIGDLGIEKPVNCVVTSPPYPNRYSYVWNTRPHLYFFDFFSNSKEAAVLDKLTVGGTWGTATSSLAKGVVSAEYPIVETVVGPIVDAIRKNDNLMANYAMKYFNLLAKQIVEMDCILAQDARLAYVVGCSRLKGIYVETDSLLSKIIEGLELGYQVSSIERFRKRHSGTELHESVVYAWKK